MDAEQVVGKILSEARAETEKITAEANEKAFARQTELENELSEYRKDTEVLAQQAGEERKARMLAAARMEMRKEHLAAKVALLGEVFQHAREQIISLPDKEYKEFINSLITKSIETGDEEIVVGKGEERIDHGMIKQLNRHLGPGYKGNLMLSNDRADIDGGFILRRGKIQINVSIDVLVSQARDALEMELINDLFTDGESS